MKRFNRFPVLLTLFAALIALAACAPQSAPSALGASNAASEVEFLGMLESTSPTEWVISGQVVKLSAQTQIQNTPAIGEMVQVRARVDANGEVTALRIETQTRQQTQAQEQIQTQSQNQGQSQSALGQPAQEFFGVVESIAPNVWVVAGRTFSVTTATEIKGNIAAGNTVKIHYLVNADGSFTAHEISLDANAAGNKREITGKVEAMSLTELVVNGQTFQITPATRIRGAIAVGDTVKVEAFVNAEGTLVAYEVYKTSGQGSSLSSGASSSGGASSGSGSSLSSGASSSGGSSSSSGSSSSDDDDDGYDDGKGGSSSSSSSSKSGDK